MNRDSDPGPGGTSTAQTAHRPPVNEPSLRARLNESGRYLGQAMRMMVGVPDYDRYVAHVRRTHPDVEPMNRDEFLRNRMQARYGSGKGGCC